MTADEMLATLTNARRAVAAGDLVDLSGLEKAVEGFCVEAATKGDRNATARELETIRDALDGLAADISAQQSTARDAETAATRGRAASVYGKARRRTP